MTQTDDLFLRIRVRHGHYCPMSTLGGRLGMAALGVLGVLGDDRGELTATYHIDTCAADGIAVATGCLPEEERLTVRSEGCHRLELCRADGTGVRAELTATALELAAACRKRLDAGDDAELVLEVLRNAAVAELIALLPLTGKGSADA